MRGKESDGTAPCSFTAADSVRGVFNNQTLQTVKQGTVQIAKKIDTLRGFYSAKLRSKKIRIRTESGEKPGCLETECLLWLASRHVFRDNEDIRDGDTGRFQGGGRVHFRSRGTDSPTRIRELSSL